MRLRGEQARRRAVVADLELELGAIAESTRLSPDDEHDPEGSTVGFERARVAGLLDRERHQLEELDEALDRVALGTYGRCEQCGEEIPGDRLAALPTTRICVGCAGATNSP